MSRSGYTDDMDDLAMGRWRAQVASAIRGKRGQRMLSDLLQALDAMPEKSLIIGELKTEQGEVCALGALGVARGMDLARIDPEDPEQVAVAFNIAPQLAQEIAYLNDDYFNFLYKDNRRVIMIPEERWTGMRKWVAAQIRNAGRLPGDASKD